MNLFTTCIIPNSSSTIYSQKRATTFFSRSSPHSIFKPLSNWKVRIQKSYFSFIVFFFFLVFKYWALIRIAHIYIYISTYMASCLPYLRVSIKPSLKLTQYYTPQAVQVRAQSFSDEGNYVWYWRDFICYIYMFMLNYVLWSNYIQFSIWCYNFFALIGCR